MPGTIFISYRRGESLAEARALYERLSRDFAGRVFIDLEGIDVGDDFIEALQRQLVGCQVMLALIGPGWLEPAGAVGRRPIDNEDDFVRIELRAALQRGIRIVPVLLNGAPLPLPAQLPAELQALVRRQAMVLDFRRFDADIGQLSHALRRILGHDDAPRRGRSRRWGVAGGVVVLMGAAALALPWWLSQRASVTPAPPAGNAGAAASAGRAASSPLLAVGARLRDCGSDQCPWLRVIPAGSFVMGSADTEPGHVDNEGPVRSVKLVRRLAVMESEVTRRQFDAFVRAAGHDTGAGCYRWNGQKEEFDGRRDWRAPGFAQTAEHPVVCISWNDAQAYARWLSELTGQRYRLPSEAEWEYAARAGSATRYSFGERDQDLCSFGNVLDLTAKAQYSAFGAGWPAAECTDGAVYTLPVRSFKPNAFNLYDVHGNVWEWVQDCWHADYRAAPPDAAAWEQGCESERRVRRGGSWRSAPQNLRSAMRARNLPDARLDWVGVRLVRELSP